MRYHHHIITNFTSDAPLYRKIFSNIIFNLGVTKIKTRDNALTKEDYFDSKKILKKGDLILMGSSRRVLGLFIKGPVKHVGIYYEKGYFIHAISDGVEKMKYKKIFEEYDTLIILRDNDLTEDKRCEIADWTYKQIGKPYNIWITNVTDSFLCSQLITEGYKALNLQCEVFNHLSGIFIHRNIPRAVDFLKTKMRIIFISSTLRKKYNGEIVENY